MWCLRCVFRNLLKFIIGVIVCGGFRFVLVFIWCFLVFVEFLSFLGLVVGLLVFLRVECVGIREWSGLVVFGVEMEVGLLDVFIVNFFR